MRINYWSAVNILSEALRWDEKMMASMGMQMAGRALAPFGWVGVLVVCGVLVWRVSAFIGTNAVTSQTMCEAIWLSCAVQSTGRIQCKVLGLHAGSGPWPAGGPGSGGGSHHYRHRRTSHSFCRRKVHQLHSRLQWQQVWCWSSVDSSAFIAVSLTSSIIIRDFYTPLLIVAKKSLLGASLYIGWGTGALLVLGGGHLCANCPPREDETPSVKYLINKSGGKSKEDSIWLFTPPKTWILEEWQSVWKLGV